MKQFFKFMFASMVGFILSCIILFFIFFGIIAGLISSSKKEIVLEPKSVLLIKLDEPVKERSSQNPFSSLPVKGFQYLNVLGLDDILKDIKKAETDQKVNGIFLDLSDMLIDIGMVEEIRNALLDFRKTGKFIIAYGDFYSQKSYYLASVADKVFLNPQGMMEWKGMNAKVVFLKGTLAKLDIDMQVIRHGKYKSAVEPLISDKMSPENKEQTLAVVQSFWDHIVSGVSAMRKQDRQKLNDLATNLSVEQPEDAVKYGLIDSLTYRDGLIAYLHKKLGTAENTTINYVGLKKYNDVPSTIKKEYSKDKIAVIYASGDIVEGEGSEDNIGSERISRAIRKARTDNSIKAIVFRVNSPGGIMISSDVIWREIMLTKKVKPVVASFGDYAASGGYYISCEANKIVAEPTTITGSIGVFGVIPNFQKTLNNKLGITTDGVMTNTNADFISVDKPLPEYQKALITRGVERSYKTFVDRVAKGRNMSPEKIDNIGQGRIWTGVMAKELGLVDEIGGINKAVEMAAGLAKLKNYRLIYLPEQKDAFTTLIEQLSGDNEQEAMIRTQLGDFYPYYQSVIRLRNMKGIQARLPFTLTID
ncbi:MAG: signal peptide peptidase SppA [Bacteroidetes bacterium]|nr:signal peptide peptidase SppA [Bacteroidota bacterium]